MYKKNWDGQKWVFYQVNQRVSRILMSGLMLTPSQDSITRIWKDNLMIKQSLRSMNRSAEDRREGRVGKRTLRSADRIAGDKAQGEASTRQWWWGGAGKTAESGIRPRSLLLIIQGFWKMPECGTRKSGREHKEAGRYIYREGETIGCRGSTLGKGR